MAMYVKTVQHRVDGIDNVMDQTRSDVAPALAQFYDECKKIVQSADFVGGAVVLLNSNLNLVKREEIVDTMYQPENAD